VNIVFALELLKHTYSHIQCDHPTPLLEEDIIETDDFHECVPGIAMCSQFLTRRVYIGA
jgi:hypothetical protein